ncbi:hypothetical protein IscW_ISCW022140 [Ixodes scapularis]|uniref:Uncharacterized protein n=1 Tax=Ixodes scapularis TaxID=6945 RepID=B7QEM9_IXOSC|nr:hypothetical protein IscW_ISCW022140 [Ixodes scapularis]|eukprot:XP_002413993.1 hypothetical protein IscW_ISCW022140 [Ixodes scapularis]
MTNRGPSAYLTATPASREEARRRARDPKQCRRAELCRSRFRRSCLTLRANRARLGRSMANGGFALGGAEIRDSREYNSRPASYESDGSSDRCHGHAVLGALRVSRPTEDAVNQDCLLPPAAAARYAAGARSSRHGGSLGMCGGGGCFLSEYHAVDVEPGVPVVDGPASISLSFAGASTWLCQRCFSEGSGFVRPGRRLGRSGEIAWTELFLVACLELSVAISRIQVRKQCVYMRF